MNLLHHIWLECLQKIPIVNLLNKILFKFVAMKSYMNGSFDFDNWPRQTECFEQRTLNYNMIFDICIIAMSTSFCFGLSFYQLE